MKQTTVNYIFWTLAAVFTVAYFFMVYQFSVNIPMDDDLGVLGNLVRFVQAENKNIHEKISIMLENGNGHRTLFLYTTVWLVYVICGNLNFSVCIFI
ncbi:MAG: hypothetical protein LBB73_08520, partial [Dysgonamonadaceae bacterium]|nr:hypothetical protein [Dysgonamonadaceae bacterium]